MSSEQFTAAPADPLDPRPALSAPDALSPAALAEARRAQPRRGLVGLLLVLPVAVLLAAGAGGPAATPEVLGPGTTFALPVVAMIAFWWEDWAGSLLRGGWIGLYDTAVVVAGGALLTLLGQSVAGHAAVPLGAGIFTIMLQLTLVCERWPLAGLGRIPAGITALAGCWVVGLAAYLLVRCMSWPYVRTYGQDIQRRSGAVAAEDYGAWLTALGAWQMVWYVALRGWPFARIPRRALRLPVANVVVVGCGWGTYLVARLAGWTPGRITAVGGIGVAAVLVVSMLFEAWPAIRLAPLPSRTIALIVVAASTALLSWVLPPLARAIGVPPAEANGWVTYTALNAVSLAVILHVAVWRRWPYRLPPG